MILIVSTVGYGILLGSIAYNSKRNLENQGNVLEDSLKFMRGSVNAQSDKCEKE
jgi:hypothetical protein